MGLFGPRGEDDGGQGRLAQSGSDTAQLVLDYIKQETLEPLQGVGRFLLFGIAGSAALCVGLVLLLVAVLRLLQTETGTTFAGDLSWVPYVIVAVLGLAVLALAAWRVTAGPAQRRRLPAAPEEGKP